MKSQHYEALNEIKARFGNLDVVNHESGLPMGWEVNLGQDIVQFNFTATSLRLFNLSTDTTNSKYRDLEKLRQCCRKSGLQGIVYYRYDESQLIGEMMLHTSAASDDGLDQIELFYKIHQLDIDDTGGGLCRLGSAKR